MRIITVMDDRPSEHLGLIHEHGLSFYIETDELRLLFDFGSGENTLKNVKKLNISPDSLDFMICSHGHYDHAGGYPFFAEAGVNCPLVTGEGFFREKYAADRMRLTYLGTGFDEEYLKSRGIEHKTCSGVLKLSDNCFVMNGFQRKYSFEKIPERFVIRDRGSVERDSFKDEICLVIRNEKGLTVVAGCSHPGILNILESVRAYFGEPVRAVIGGTHMVEADEERIQNTLNVMKSFGTELLGLNHCSGETVCRLLRERNDFNAVYLGAGDCLYL